MRLGLKVYHGKGMPQKEKLRVLGSCLKGSRARVYKNMIRWAREAGHLDSDPTRVYEDIRERLMEYRQTTMERRTQADLNFSNLQKGNMSALQFRSLFEGAVHELYIT